MGNDPFLQNDGETMKNLVGVDFDPGCLRDAERELTALRRETLPETVSGNFDEQHLRDIHRHIFQDVYEWAGTMRSDTIRLEGETVHVPSCAGLLSKGNTTFLPSTYLENGLAQVEKRSNTPAALSSDRATFADAATEILSDLNHVHPFREGNGRAQRAFMQQLAERAGHVLDFEGVTQERNIIASIEAHNGKTEKLHHLISESLDPGRVALRLDAVRALERSGVDIDNFSLETAEPNARIEGRFVGQTSKHATFVTNGNELMIIPQEALMREFSAGETVSFTFQPP